MKGRKVLAGAGPSRSRARAGTPQGKVAGSLVTVQSGAGVLPAMSNHCSLVPAFRLRVWPSESQRFVPDAEILTDLLASGAFRHDQVPQGVAKDSCSICGPEHPKGQGQAGPRVMGAKELDLAQAAAQDR